MKSRTTFSNLYGQLRGYNRLSIRREVSRAVSVSAAELQAKSLRLRQGRCLYAIKNFPAYAELVAKHVGCPVADIDSVPFEKLPILSKSDIRSIFSVPGSNPPVHRSSFSLHRSPRIPHSTGGSTGQPLKFFITRESYEWRSAVSDRGYSWAQAEEGQRSFYVWGTAIKAPGIIQKLKTGFHHWLQNREYFDSFHFDDAAKEECCRRINKFRPVSLVGYAGNLIELARFVKRNPEKLKWRAKTAVTAAEGLRPGMRELIEEHLADEVFMSYGSREFMLIGMENKEHSGYHISSDNLYVEVVDDDGVPLPAGESGRIVVTDLHNDATPFVRYEIGDLGVMGGGLATEDTEGTEAGGFPVLLSVEGRLQEVIVRADGEKLTALFIPHLMKEFEWVDGYQVVQDKPGMMVMHLLTEDSEWKQKSEGVREELVKKLGREMEIGFERVERLEKNASGKTPIVCGRI
jgi:phenylacetate-CoA ligase